MANESAHVYQKYADALNATTIQGATIGADGRVQFVDTTLLVLEGNTANRLAEKIYLKNTIDDKIYVSKANADKYQLPADGNPGSEIEFMDRLGLKTAILSFDRVENSPAVDKYTSVETTKGTQTQREVPNFNPNWGYQPVSPKPVPADAVSVKSVADAGGSFDVNKTYVINNKEDLVALQTLTNAGKSTKGINFILGGDIDMTGVTWQGIGKTEALAFQGNFDGNGYTISNLKGSKGLFGYVKGDATATTNPNNGANVSASYGHISNVVLQNVDIDSTTQETGALIGKNVGGYVDNCYASGDVNAKNWTGGMIGHNIKGAITSSTSNVNISNATNCTGGFIGHDTNGILEHCISTGNVKGTSSVGGLIGHETAGGTGFIFQSATTSNVSATSSGGAFIGAIDGGCKATVIGSQYSGASGKPPVGSGAGNMTSNGNDDSLTQHLENLLLVQVLVI